MKRARLHREQLLLIALALLLAVPLIPGAQIQPALVGSSYTLTGNQTIAGTNRLINITVTNLNDTNRSITNLTISLPTGFTYLNSTNQTNLTSLTVNFTNLTTNNLTWYSFNTTSGILNISQVAWFAFNVSTWATAGDYNLTIYAIDNGTVPLVNATTLTFTIIGANTSNGTFSVNKPILRANWSVDTLLVASNINNSNLSVLFNATNTTIVPLSFAASHWPASAYANLGTVNRSLCLGDAAPNGTGFIAMNATHYLNGSVGNVPLNLTLLPVQNVTIAIMPFCPPGQYRGNLTLANATNQSDNLSLQLHIDVPLNGSNTLTTSPGNITGWIRGNLTAGLANNADNRNASAYQRTFLTSNRTSNQTFLTINLSSLSGNADIFLLNGSGTGQLLGSSTVLASAADSIDGIWLAGTGFYELRVAGNATTDYNILAYFAPLNITNQSSTGENVTELDYGTMNVSNDTNSSSRNLNFSLTTAVDTNVTSLAQSIELWHVDRFTNRNAISQSYWTLVPNFTQKLLVLLEWPANTSANNTFWGMNLTRPDGLLLNSSSTEPSISSNASNTTVRTWIEYFGPFNYTNEGWWNVTVLNTTAGSANGSTVMPYNLTVRAYLAASDWVKHNFSSPSTLYSTSFTTTNSSYAQNNSLLLRTNITTPSANALNGSYEGAFRWYNGTGWTVKLPFKFDVRAGGLALNSSVRNLTVTITQNIGLNSTESNVSTYRSANLSYNNTGYWPLTIGNASNTSLNLTSTGPSINYTVYSALPDLLGSNATGFPNGSASFNLTFNINRSIIGSNSGLYIGNFLFNMSNNTNSTNQSYPVQLFNLSFRLNLTDKLIGSVATVALPAGNKPGIVLNRTNGTYITATANLSYANGTSLSVAGGIFTTTTFHRMWLNHSNISNITYLANISDATDNDTAISCSGTCNLGATVPAGLLPGGNYTLAVDANWVGGSGNNISTVNLTGTVSNTSFLVDAAGLHLAHVTGISLTMDEGTKQVYNVSVTNYGTQTYNGTLYLTATATSITITAKNATGPAQADCRSAVTGGRFSMAVPANGTKCYVVWELDAANISADASSTVAVIANGSINTPNHSNTTIFDQSFNNLTSITLTNHATDPGSSGGSTGGGGGGAGTSCTADSDCGASYYCSTTCKALSCTDDQYISNHACKDRAYTLNITESPSYLEVNLSGSANATLTVKNTGDVAFVATADASAGSGVNSSTSPASANISINGTQAFTVTLAASKDAAIGNRTGQFRAFRSGREAALASKDFTLFVIPTEEKKAEIRATADNLSAFLSALASELNALLATVAASDKKTEAQSALTEAQAKLTEAQAAIAASDYVAADQALTAVKAAIEKARTSSSELKAEAEAAAAQSWGSLWIWVVVGIAAVVVIVVVVYMLLPPKSPKGAFTPKGYVPPAGAGLGSKLSGLFKRKKKQPWQQSGQAPLAREPGERKISSYAGQPATRPGGFSYAPPKQGFARRLKGLFRRKKQPTIAAYLPHQ